MLILSFVLAIVLVSTAISLRNLRLEVVLLRESLGRAGAVNVAVDELDREATAMSTRVVATRDDARERIGAARPRHRHTGR